MFQSRGIKFFHLVRIIISIFFGIFVVCQIESEIIHLNPIIVTSGNPVEARKTCGQGCNVSGDLLSINTQDLYSQIKGFDSFVPLSAIAKFNLELNYLPEGNAFLEITYPKYSEKIRDIEIFCNNESISKFSSKISYKTIENIKTTQIAEKISEYFSCEKPDFKLSYDPTQKVEVGPNEYVRITTQGKDLVVNLNNIVVTLTPNWLIKFLIFLISTFINLGAGTILYLYLHKMGIFYEK